MQYKKNDKKKKKREKHFWVLMLTVNMNYHLNCIKSSVQPVPVHVPVPLGNDNIQSMCIAHCTKPL